MGKKSTHPGIRALEKPEKTCRRWRITVCAGRDYVNKGYIRQERNFKGTLTEARAAQRAFQREVESGINGDLTSMTFAQYSERWLKERESLGRVSPGTLRKNRYHLSVLLPIIGNVKLSKIDTPTVKKTLAKLREEGELANGKPRKALSGTSASNIFTTMKCILGEAVKDKAILSNPCTNVSAPKNDTKEKDALPTPEARRLAALLSSRKPTSSTIGFLLALSCGLRREEACGLRWKDLDAQAGFLRVEHALTVDDYKAVEKGDAPLSGTKNGQTRYIPLDTETLGHLQKWKTSQAIKLLGKGIPQRTTTHIVCTIDGGPTHPQNLTRAWERYAKAHGFEGYSLHQLRHTFATRLVANGVDMKTAAVLMGHSTTAMLEKIYAHLVPENAARAMELVSADLYGDHAASVIPFVGLAKGA